MRSVEPSYSTSAEALLVTFFFLSSTVSPLMSTDAATGVVPRSSASERRMASTVVAAFSGMTAMVTASIARLLGMNWLIKNFLRGLVIVVPIALTLYLLYEAFVRIDALLALKTPGVGFAVTIVAIIAIGAVASNFFVRKFLQLTEAVFTRAPLVR